MRVALGCFAQESHSFSPISGSWEHFSKNELARGTALIDEYTGTGTELGGILNVLAKDEVVPLLAARANASAGAMEKHVFEAICDELLQRLRDVLPVDGVLLVLHGAMIAEYNDDASGVVLARVRELIGPDTPLIATLDLHANVTRQMIASADALVGYHTYPHVDMSQTGQRAARLIQRIHAGLIKPHMTFKKIPMALPGETTQTTDGAYGDVVRQAQAYIRDKADVIDISVFSVQPWLDVAEMGSSIVVVTDDRPDIAENIACTLADAFWVRRHELLPDLPDAEEAVAAAFASENTPVILADSADAPTSGAPGDSTTVLRILIEKPPQKPCLLNIVDAHAVQQMAAAGIGMSVTVDLGASKAPDFYSSVSVEGRVRLLSDGEFTHKGPGMHGLKMYRGLTGVLQVGVCLSIVVMERPCWQWDAELYRSVGLAPEDAQLVMVKSPAAFRASYEPFAGDIIVCDTKGVCSPDLTAFPFERVPRPFFPLDDFDWDCKRQ
jgi:microcystin degradation protein MlrC